MLDNKLFTKGNKIKIPHIFGIKFILDMIYFVIISIFSRYLSGNLRAQNLYHK